LILRTSQLFADLFGVENDPAAIRRRIRAQLKSSEKESERS